MMLSIGIILTDPGRYCFDIQNGKMVVIMGTRKSNFTGDQLLTAYAYRSSETTCPTYIAGPIENFSSDFKIFYDPSNGTFSSGVIAAQTGLDETSNRWTNL